MEENALDFLLFIVTAAVVTALGVMIVIPNSKNIAELKYKEYSDKTAVYTLETGEEMIDNEKSYYTIDEVVLIVMGQSYFMPEPKKIDIAGNILVIKESDGFVPNSVGIGNAVFNSANEWFTRFKNSVDSDKYGNIPDNITDCKFSIQYSYNDSKDLQDDTYSLFIILTDKADGKDKYYLCTDLA